MHLPAYWVTDVFHMLPYCHERVFGVSAHSTPLLIWNTEVVCSFCYIELFGPLGFIGSGKVTWSLARPRCTHIQISKTSAILWSNCWWWRILWQEVIAKEWVPRIKNLCLAQKHECNCYVLNIDSFRFCSGTKIKTTFQDLLFNR